MLCRRCSRLLPRRSLAKAAFEPSELEAIPPERIRNFSIIAHVDHGKSTLADRLLEETGTVERGGRAQLLDQLKVEQERGITVKAQTASMTHDGHLLNLVDTPGHVDFHYEVRRSLQACDGALFLVDAAHGIQAQTVANFWLAFELGLPLLPILNKCDLKDADPDGVAAALEEMFELPAADCLRVSAKAGTGVPEVLDAVIQRLPPPKRFMHLVKQSGELLPSLRFTHFVGCIALVVVKEGSVRKGDSIRSLHSGKDYAVTEVGVCTPSLCPSDSLRAGQVGYVMASMKTPGEAVIGDTLAAPPAEGEELSAAPQPLIGFQPVQPMVFAGLFPVETSDYESLRSAVTRLCLNDPAVSVEKDSSPALGQGWRLGFLGLLHMEVFGQRLEDEYAADVILCAPSVPYKALLKDAAGVRKRYGGAEEVLVTDPGKFPPSQDVRGFLEPTVRATIICPMDSVGAMDDLCRNARGVPIDVKSLQGNRALVRYTLPLSEVIVNFFDELKRRSSGYASFDYEEGEYVPADIALLNVKLNGKVVPEFARVVPASSVKAEGYQLVERLKREIPRQVYDVEVKVTAEGKSVTGTKIKAIKKDFTQKLKGNFGDITRLQKLLKHQKEGQQRMKVISQVQIPKKAFVNILRK